MASGDTLLPINPFDFFPAHGNNPAGGEFGLVVDGLVKGVAFNPTVDSYAYALKRLPKTAAMATGLTFKLLLAVDPNSSEVSKTAVFSVNCGIVGTTGHYYTPATTVLGTANTGTVQLASTAGDTREVSIAITTANAGGAAADQWALIQIGRVGTSSSETSKARVLLLGVTVLDT